MAREKNPQEDAATASPKAEETAQTRVVWDDTQMITTFANVINVFNSQEEFTFLFGTNQTWNLSNSRELTVRLSNRIVLTPHAAKRLQALLTARINDYEKRFSPLSLE
jgi:uncharacterized protein DUF3467